MQSDDRPDLTTRLFTGWGRDLALAGAFLTRLPFRPKAPAGMAELAPASRAFPLIGLIVGAAAGALMWIAAAADLHPLACGFIGLAAAAWLTGALHEDGLADFADGIGVRDRDQRLEIMRDSRIGTFGVLALIFTIGIKAALLAGFLGPGLAWAALIAAAALSRAVLPAIMHRLAPARADGLGHGAGQPDGLTALTALGLGAATAFVCLGPAAGATAVLMAACAAGIVGWLARRRLGGYTGDVLGAAQQAAETAVFIAAGAFAA